MNSEVRETQDKCLHFFALQYNPIILLFRTLSSRGTMRNGPSIVRYGYQIRLKKKRDKNNPPQT